MRCGHNRFTMCIRSLIVKANLQQELYGYRPRLSAQYADGRRSAHLLLNSGHKEVVDADLSRDVSEIPHAKPGALHERRVHAGTVRGVAGDPSVMFGSPETMSRGRALKCDSPVRLDSWRMKAVKEGTDTVGNRSRVEVVTRTRLLHRSGRRSSTSYTVRGSVLGELVDLGIAKEVLRKSGSRYGYGSIRIGKGWNAARIGWRIMMLWARELGTRSDWR